MIRFLSIQNLAVVDAIDLELSPGLTVLTGETGAGKSIVLGALALLVGGRATGDLVRSGEPRARVQATIEDDDGSERILRREVTVQGRSRAFVDDALTTAGTLQQIGRRLVDLHGQHDHQTLLDAAAHLSLLDTYAGLEAEGAAVAAQFRKWRAVRSSLEQAQRTGRDKAQRIDQLSFQRDDIDAVQPIEEEDVALEAKRARLANAERLMALCSEAYGALYERDDAILGELAEVWRQVAELGEFDEVFGAYLDGRPGVTAQLEDLAFFLRSYRAKIETSPAELSAVEERLAELERLKRKYGPSLVEVRRHRDQVSSELDALAATSEQVDALVSAEAEARSVFVRLSADLGLIRREGAGRLSIALERVLHDLAMPHAKFEARFQSEPLTDENWTERGTDTAEFFFSANLGESLRPLARVASGGELSRVMLGLKTLASSDRIGKTLVFDEVDAGIGGAAADRVGEMLRQVSRGHQVLCVTHLPQIAAYATSHYHVSKLTQDGRTVTRIAALSEEERVCEIARLMTGGHSAAARAGARELITGKENTKGESLKRKRKLKAKG